MKQVLKKIIKGLIPGRVKNKLISLVARVVSEQLNLHVGSIYQKFASLEKSEHKLKEFEHGFERYDQRLASLEKVEYKLKEFEHGFERYDHRLASLEKVEYKLKEFEHGFERYDQRLASLEKVECKLKEFEHGFERYDQRLAGLEKVEYKLKEFEHGFERYDQRLAGLEKVEYKLKELEQGFERYEQRLESLEKIEYKLRLLPCNENFKMSGWDCDDSADVFNGFEYDHVMQLICRGRKVVEKNYYDSLSNNFPPKAKILDLGCGDGSFLKQMNEKGFSAEGIDANIEYINEPYVTLGILPQGLENFPDNTYDVITSFHLIEHLPLEMYKKMAQEAYRLLKKGGKIFFETPNTQSLITMSLYYYKDPTHLMPRHPEVYANILSFNGYENVKIKNLVELDSQMFDDSINECSDLSEQCIASFNAKFSKIERLLDAGSGNVLIVGEK